MVAAATLAAAAVAEDRLSLLVQPGLGAPDADYRPLAHYLGERLGLAVVPRVAANALEHWSVITGDSPPDLVLDEAHFTDFRLSHLGYALLVKLPGTVGATVATAPGTLILDLDELHGRPVACPAPPALAALRLLALFPDPVRRPLLVEARSTGARVAALLSGAAAAAVLAPEALAGHPELNAVVEFEPAPAPGLSAAPSVPAHWRAALIDALLEARDSAAGGDALAAARIRRFETATPALYEGRATVLRGMWGVARVGSP